MHLVVHSYSYDRPQFQANADTIVTNDASSRA
jgi:hypothetical protein